MNAASQPRAVQGGEVTGPAAWTAEEEFVLDTRSFCFSVCCGFGLVLVFSFRNRQREAEGDVFELSSVCVIPGAPGHRQAGRFPGVRLPNPGSVGSGWFSPCWPGAAGTCGDRASGRRPSHRRPGRRDAISPVTCFKPVENSASKSEDAGCPWRHFLCFQKASARSAWQSD